MADTTKKVMRITHLIPGYVSLVDMGANRGGERHFFSLKSRDAEVVPPALACLDCRGTILIKAAAGDVAQCPSCGSERIEIVDKAVPESDATDDAKAAALQARAKRYGIEARDDAGLTYPAGSPSTETLYADPVNLAYPMGKDGDEPDAERIQDAIAQFKENHEAYAQTSSKARIYERIVRAALKADVKVAYDANDPIDALLPSDLREVLASDETKTTDKIADTPPAPPALEPAPDLASPAPEANDMSWLTDAAARVDALDQQISIDQRLAAVEGAVADPPSAPSVKRTSDEDALRKRAEDAEARAVEAETRATESEAELLRKTRAADARQNQGIHAGTARRPGAYTSSTDGGEEPVTWGTDLAEEAARS